jgi:ribosomal protein S14
MNKECVKVVADEYGPAHLILLTRSEHMSLQQGMSKPRGAARKKQKTKDFCKRNHDIRVVGRDKYGVCRECIRERARGEHVVI